MSETILIVDDNDEIRELTKRMLERDGFSVATAHDGFEALRMVKESVPAMVILDLMMPGMSGWEVFDFLRQHEPTAHTPVMILSARDSTGDVSAGYEYGADMYLAKPFTRPQLLAAVRTLLGKPAPKIEGS